MNVADIISNLFSETGFSLGGPELLIGRKYKFTYTILNMEHVIFGTITALDITEDNLLMFISNPEITHHGECLSIISLDQTKTKLVIKRNNGYIEGEFKLL